MKVNSILAALLLLLAGLQTAWGQGFRVYKSDGTVAQFSLRTDSIVFYDGIGTDQDFGPFTPVNQCIAKTWYKSKYETVTFNEDGTTDYMAGATYKFFPYQGTIIIYNASGAPMNILKVHELTAEQMIVTPEGGTFSVWSSTLPVQLVTGITLSETMIRLQVDESKRITATVEPADADNPAVTWSSSNDDVAEVNRGRVTANAKGTCIITCSANDGSGVKAECQVTVMSNDESGIINGREYVDLGLPSGTLWATCNVGASSPKEYGGYFAWGETTTKSDYSWSTYFDTNDNGSTFIKYYNNGGLTELQPADDAATANWGSKWQMPSSEQMQELCDNSYTASEYTKLDGVYGYKITSNSNNNSIFLPAAGHRYSTFVRSEGFGFYWSRSLNTSLSDNAYGLHFYSTINRDYGTREIGRCVRPVRVLE